MPTVPVVGSTVKIDGRTIRAINGTLIVGEVPAGNIAGEGASVGDVMTWNGTAWVPAAPSGGSSERILSGGSASTTAWDFFMNGGDATSVYAPYQLMSGGGA